MVMNTVVTPPGSTRVDTIVLVWVMMMLGPGTVTTVGTILCAIVVDVWMFVLVCTLVLICGMLTVLVPMF